jgi:hypothetical protein
VSVLSILGALSAAIGDHGSWALIGAFARNAWAPPRATTDLDLTVVANGPTLAAATAALEASGYFLVRQQRAAPDDPLPDILVFRSDRAALRQIDILIAKTSFEADVVKRAEMIVIDDRPAPVAGPEALIVYKLLADRPRDREDIRAVVRTQARAGRSLDWSYVECWTEFWRIGDRLARLRQELNVP